MSTKIITGKCRASFVHIFEPKSVNGSDPKYSMSLIIPKSDTKTLRAIRAALDRMDADIRKTIEDNRTLLV